MKIECDYTSHINKNSRLFWDIGRQLVKLTISMMTTIWIIHTYATSKIGSKHHYKTFACWTNSHWEMWITLLTVNKIDIHTGFDVKFFLNPYWLLGKFSDWYKSKHTQIS